MIIALNRAHPLLVQNPRQIGEGSTWPGFSAIQAPSMNATEKWRQYLYRSNQVPESVQPITITIPQSQTWGADMQNPGGIIL